MEATLPCTFFRWVDFVPAPSLLPEEKVPSFARRMRWKGHGFLQRCQCRVEFPSRAISLLLEEMPSFVRRMPWKRPVSLRRRRSRAASCVISCFQSSMLLHNLSSVFSLGRKASQRALHSSRVLLRTIATAHPAAATPHHAAPRPAVPHHAAPRPACPAPAPFPAAAGFPQAFHRVSHISAGFPQRLSFPLAFLERDSVRSSESWVLPAA